MATPSLAFSFGGTRLFTLPASSSTFLLPKLFLPITRANINIPSKEKKFEMHKYFPSPERSVLVGCGAISIDYLASVVRFPQPDEKIRSVDSKIQGGGNTGNCLTAAARLGLKPRILSKVSQDAFGMLVINELQCDGVDTSFVVISETGSTSFTYIIVDQETSTRTCINSPGTPPLDPKEIPFGAFSQILDGACILYLDGRLPDVALLLAKQAKDRSIPILIDAERKREGLDELLALADYVVCSSKFPQEWTEAATLPEALLEMALRLPDLKFVIVTLGASGCLMLEKNFSDISPLDILDANIVHKELLEEKTQKRDNRPFAISSKIGLFQSTNTDCKSMKEVVGRLLIGSAEAIPTAELVDTTGSGDAFIGAVLYSLCVGMPPEEMLPFGAAVAGSNCRALGARAGLPYYHDPKLIPYLGFHTPRSHEETEYDPFDLSTNFLGASFLLKKIYSWFKLQST